MDVTLAQSKSISSRSQCLARSSELCDLSDIDDNRGYLRILFHDNMANILNCESELLVFQGFCCFRLIIFTSPLFILLLAPMPINILLFMYNISPLIFFVIALIFSRFRVFADIFLHIAV